MANIIHRAQDCEIRLTLKDKTTGVASNLSTCTKLAVLVYYGDSGKILDKFSKNADPDWKELNVADAATGVLKFKLQTEITKTAKLGKIYAEVRAVFPDTGYTGNEFDLIGRGIYVATIEDSTSDTLQIP